MNHDMQETLSKLIGGKAESLVHHADAFLDFWSVLEKEDQQEALKDLMTRYRLPAYKTGDPINGGGLSQERIKELTDKVGTMVDATLTCIISNRMEPDMAAEEVRRLLEGREDKDEQVFCLAGILSSNVIPYAVVPEFKTQLSNELYQELLKELSEGVSRIRIASGVSKNAAEMADLVLSVVDQEMEWEKKVALLAYFIVLRERTVMAGKGSRSGNSKKETMM
ncbi:hypothetical protein [Desulfoluna spongiiphila]|uniref:Uncharacterized protein n=1 Tax=Desulfoluna spongiiphila TaxID=419481 RepID=A0A1G5B330_9BACT|nr:hypothetical protein [Desulfoluna spongiiphila]SCX84450.1 hypothetical protein SAMN05216233_101589 [Desulfoluna spongiiphila]VVS92148.1 hypothetical protein DBB_17160 [Desulfoluna spongiiphila]